MQWLMKLMREYKVFGSNLLLHKYELVAIRLKTPILWNEANLKPCKKVSEKKRKKECPFCLSSLHSEAAEPQIFPAQNESLMRGLFGWSDKDESQR